MRRLAGPAGFGFGLGLALASAAAYAALYVKSPGQPLLSAEVNGVVQSTDLITDLNVFVGTVGTQVLVRGTAAPADGQAKLFYWNPNSTAAPDGITVLQPISITGPGRWLITPLSGLAVTPATNTSIGVVQPDGVTCVVSAGILTCRGNGGRPTLRTVTTGSTDSASLSDGPVGTIAWNSSASAAKEETLVACNSGSLGYTVTIVDEIGTALSYPITVVAAGGGTVGGLSSYLLPFANQSVAFQCDGSGNWIAT